MSMSPYQWAEYRDVQSLGAGNLGGADGAADVKTTFAAGYDPTNYVVGFENSHFKQKAFDYFCEAGIFRVPNAGDNSAINADGAPAHNGADGLGSGGNSQSVWYQE